MSSVQVLGTRRLQAGGDLVVSSTKGATGHLLGAAGAVETIFTVLAMRHRQWPPGTNLLQPDDVSLRCLALHGEQHGVSGRGAALCNSFGFGGTNACVVVKPILS